MGAAVAGYCLVDFLKDLRVVAPGDVTRRRGELEGVAVEHIGALALGGFAHLLALANVDLAGVAAGLVVTTAGRQA